MMKAPCKFGDCGSETSSQCPQSKIRAEEEQDKDSLLSGIKLFMILLRHLCLGNASIMEQLGEQLGEIVLGDRTKLHLRDVL